MFTPDPTRSAGGQPKDQRILDARVVFLTHYIPLYQVRVLQSIARRVRDFHVLLSTPIEPNRDFAPDWSGLDVTVQDTLTMRRRWRHRSGGFDDPLYVHFPYDTPSRLKQLRPDVVMSLELGARSAGAALYCRRHPEAKLVLCTYMSERTEQGRGWLRRSLRKRLIRAADALTYNGPSCRDYLLACGAAPEQLHHFPYAADDRTVYRGPIDRDDERTRHRLLCVGQLSERKGVLPLLGQLSDYCRARPNRRFRLTFAGDGPLRSAVRSYPVPPNLSLELLGNVTPAELSRQMLSSGVLVAPTLADEWMLAINEALHAGLPVIGSVHAQAVTTLVRDGENGWKYDPNADGTLARAIDHYLDQSPQRINDMRIAARQSVAERTPEWAAEGAIKALRSVLGESDTQASDVNTAGPKAIGADAMTSETTCECASEPCQDCASAESPAPTATSDPPGGPPTVSSTTTPGSDEVQTRQEAFTEDRGSP